MKYEDTKSPTQVEKFAEEIASHVMYVANANDYDLLVDTFCKIIDVKTPPRRKRELLSIFNQFLVELPERRSHE